MVREMREETNLTLTQPPEQFKLFSDPQRDKRRHTVSMVFRSVVGDDEVRHMHKGDDAKAVRLVPLATVMDLDLAFDHRSILRDYIARYHPHLITK